MRFTAFTFLCSVCGFCVVTAKPSKSSEHGGVKAENFDHSHQRSKAQEQCFYEVCDLGNPDMLNVHLIAHAHNDLGYKKTVDQYYYGAWDIFIQPGAVQYILDTVTLALDQNPERRFIFVEVGFLIRWWRQQTEATKTAFIQMVQDGRMELVMGGWGSNDEGATHYSGIIDQMSLGLRFLRETFGDKCGVPKVAWQIDEFGHSREQTSLFAMMGFDGLFFGRISYQDKEKRMQDKTLEHMWFGSKNLGDQSSLFTGIMYNRYGPPFEIWPLEPIMDDPLLQDYNVPTRVQQFVDTAQDWSKSYATNHIMMLMGEDFEYSNAFRNYKQLDKLIKYVNEAQQNGSMVNAIMSTPTCYLYALNQANITYTSKSDDFMPLESDHNEIWSGYFTSRPNLKRYARTSNDLLQACKQWDSLGKLGQQDKIFTMAEQVAIMQHHDAMTGTCNQHVANDYALRLNIGNLACQDVAQTAYQSFLPLDESVTVEPPVWTFCDLRNVSYCPVTENNAAFTVQVYNPMGVAVTSWVRVPVSGTVYNVRGPDMSDVTAQVVPISKETEAIPDRSGSVATAELIFQASIPSVGFSTYFVEEQIDKGTEQGKHHQDSVLPEGEQKKDDKLEKTENNERRLDTVLENEFLAVTFDEITGELKSLTNKEQARQLLLSQTLSYYLAYEGGSSVYYLIPNDTQTIPITTAPLNTTLIQGPNVQEFHQVYSDWASQVFRLYSGDRHLEVEWTVGPIPIDDEVGKEVISSYTTNLNSNELFYTDSNGREIIQRRRNYQPTWNLNVTNEVGVNYYPVNTRIYLQDESTDTQFTVLTDRSHGGSSLQDGQLEIMLQRRFTAPSSGVGDSVFNEPGIDGRGIVVRGRHLLQVDSLSSAAQAHRDTAQKLYSEPIISFSPQTLPPAEYTANFYTQRSFVTAALPANVHLLTLETMNPDQILLRLEHFYENNEGPLSADVSLQLTDLFVGLTISSLEEMTLGGNQPLAAVSRLQWDVEGYGRTAANMTQFVTPVDPVTLEVVLKPMQIRTFILQVQYN